MLKKWNETHVYTTDLSRDHIGDHLKHNSFD